MLNLLSTKQNQKILEAPYKLERGQLPETRRKQIWVAQANQKIVQADKIRNRPKAARVRNRLVNRAYAEMYLNDPATFKWAGLAAFASRSAGGKLGLLREGGALDVPAYGSDLMVGMALWLSSATCDYLYDRVSQGNRAIYEDIFWQHLAYREGGINELALIHAQGDLPGELLAAWQQIDLGKKTGNEKLIWDGNTDLLEYEQREVIQPILYEGNINRPLWKLISVVDKFLGLLITSPVPEGEEVFRDYLPQGNLSDFSDRWNWCTQSIFPAWRDFEAAYPEKVKELLARI